MTEPVHFTSAIAPGKVMISGEYVVLDGGTAIATSVDVLAIARLANPYVPRDEAHVATPEVLEVERLGQERARLPKHLDRGDFRIQVDRSAFFHDGVKLGLGASAATAAAASAAYLLEAAVTKGVREIRDDVFRLAFDAHKSVAPQGSGADVAASVYGGVISIVAQDRYPEITPVSWPESLHASVIWSGAPARTSDQLSKVRALAERSPRHYRDRAAFGLRSAAEDFHDAFVGGDPYAIIDATEAHARGMTELGHLADVEIMTSTLGRICLLAARYGGAGKPSGAGGGDVAIAFFTSADDKKSFEDGCRAEGFAVLSVALGVEGARSFGDGPSRNSGLL